MKIREKLTAIKNWIKGLFNKRGFWHLNPETGKFSFKEEFKNFVTHPTWYVLNKLSLGWLRKDVWWDYQSYTYTRIFTLIGLYFIPTYGPLCVITYFILPGVYFVITHWKKYLRYFVSQFEIINEKEGVIK